MNYDNWRLASPEDITPFRLSKRWNQRPDDDVEDLDYDDPLMVEMDRLIASWEKPEKGGSDV